MPSNTFQPEGVEPDAYSHTTVILIVFLSNKEHQGIEHVHIDLVVWCEECRLYMQNGILPFMEFIEANLQKVQDKHAENKDPGRVHSYSLLVANYGGVMAVPTDPLYCLVYPTVYNTGVEDQNHFNTAASPSVLHTCSCICHTLLQHADMEPVCPRTYKGSHLIIPHGAQYRTLFPEIAAPHNHRGLLIDHNTGELYPMASAGDFCLVDPIFPGSPGDSLLLKEDDLAQLKRKGFCIPIYKEEKLQPTVPKEDKHKSPCTKENAPSSSHREEESHKTTGRNSEASSPWAPDSSTRENAPPQPRTMTLKNTGPPPPSTGTGLTVTKAASTDLIRRAAALPASTVCHHLHVPALGNAHGRNLMLKNPPICPVRTHMSTTGARLRV